ncbi:TonB-dependent receptor domain-containing protein [Novosphingobium sp. MMS21-SN21R]|uniref:TonB-dependent receptor n=1 Tax=Novosphingobium sp. MMS21-SN21R TaxID=2969298 RepID=UPI002884A8CB|nr:TonB-dependent receptor [Novosphingobium sp. MMS21-SN21R]MDT0508724.1 TonB-dependent receptor [Novosphingobium sp. MMS21-SN21R]
MKSNFAGRTGQAALLASACGLALAFSSAARAQDSAPAAEEQAQPAADIPEAVDGNEIIVTATKREQTLQDIPVAVSVTSAETIERAQIRDIKDLSSLVPSLRVNQLQSSANTNFYIRGFGNGANNAGIEPSVGLFVDGVYRSRSASMIADLPDVQRVEVLKGPQSTLFGKNASAGVISLVTRKPQFEFGGNVEASYGNFDALVLKGVITGPISESIAASIAGGYNRRDGFVEDLGTGEQENERNRWFVRGQILLEPTTALSVRLIGDYSKIDENCCAVVNIRQAAPSAAIKAIGAPNTVINDPANKFGDVIYNNIASTNNIENWGLSGQIDYELGPITLTSITAYRRTNAVTDQDSDFTAVDLLGKNFQNLRLKTFTQEFRAATNWDGPVNALLGAFYFNEKVDQQNDISWGTRARPYANLLIQGASGCRVAAPTCTSVPALEAQLSQLTGRNLTGTFFGPGQGLKEQYALKNEAYSFFGQVDFKIADRLTLTGGLNYTHDSKDYSTNTTSNDVFAGLDFIALGRAGGIAQGLAGFGVNPGNPAAVQAFATGAATAPIFQAIVAGATAASTNPALNPLLGLTPFQFFPPFQNVPNAVESGNISDGDISYTARLAWEATDTVNVYAAYSTGYKAASVNLSRDSRPTAADLVQLRARGLAVSNLSSGSRFAAPEDSTLYEFGLKGNWGVASANFAVFKQSIKGFQSNIFTGTGFFLANAGKQSVFGIEFDGAVHPTEELTLSLAMTYLDPKYDSFQLSAFGDLSGSTPAGVSPLSTTMAFSYDQPLGNGDHLILRADYHYEAAFNLVEGLPNLIFRNPDGSRNVSAALAAAREFRQEINDVNASLTYAMENGLSVSVWGRNLLDNRNLLQIFDSPAQQGSLSGYPNQPRTYGVSARFNF